MKIPFVEIFEQKLKFTSEINEKTQEKFFRVQNMIVQKADVPNKNGRIYTESILSSRVKTFQEKIENGQSFMLVNHPKKVDTDRKDLPEKDVTKIGALITRLEGPDSNGYVFADCTIAENQIGKDLAGVLKIGCNIGVSSRGNGTSEPTSFEGREGFSEVQEDFILEGFDFVIGQSVREAQNLNMTFEQENSDMTLEEFKKNHPALYSQIVETATGVANEAKDKELEEALSKAETKLTEETDKKIAEVNSKHKTTYDSIVEALITGGVLDDSDTIPDNEKDQAIATSKKANEALETKLDDVNRKLEINEAQRVAEQKIGEDADAKKHFATQLRECKTVKEVESVFKTNKALAESVRKNIKAKTPTSNEDAPKAPQGSINEDAEEDNGRKGDLTEAELLENKRKANLDSMYSF